MKKFILLILPFLSFSQANNPNEIGLSNVQIMYFSNSFDEEFGRDAYFPYLYYVNQNGVVQDNLMDSFLFMDLFNNSSLFENTYKTKDLNYYLDNIFKKTKLIEKAVVGGNNFGLIDKRRDFGISKKNISVTPCTVNTLKFDIKTNTNIGNVPNGIMVGIEFLDSNKNNLYLGNSYNGSQSGCSNFLIGDNLTYSSSTFYHFYYKYFDVNNSLQNKSISIYIPQNAAYVNIHVLNRQPAEASEIEYNSDLLIDNVKFNNAFGTNLILTNDSNFDSPILTTSFEQANYDNTRELRPNASFLFDDRTALLDELLAAKNLSQNLALRNKTTKIILTIPRIEDRLYLGVKGSIILDKITNYLNEIENRFNAWSSANPNSNIELDGIYFSDEAINQDKWNNFAHYLLPTIKMRVANKGWKFYACPYNDMDNAPCVAESGYCTDALNMFDVTWQQPNAFFSDFSTNRDQDVIKRIMPDVNSNLMGVEIESRVVDIAGGEPYGRINDYFDYGNKYGYVNFSRLHYDDAGAYYINSKSNEPIKRQDYDNLYKYVRKGKQGKIINHDFEHYENGKFYNWVGDYTKYENTFSKSKARLLEFQKDSYINPIYTETFPLKANQNYSFHCQMKENFNDGFSESGLVGFYFYDKSGNTINPTSINGLTYSPMYNCWYKYMNPTTIFTNFDHTFTTPPNTVTVKMILTEWQTSAILTWKDLKLKDLTSGEYTPEQFYKGTGSNLLAETKIANGKYSIKLGDDQTASSEWKIPITPNINYSLQISAKELLPILNENKNNKALVGIKCYDKNGLPLYNVISSLAYSSTLGMNYFYINTINQVWSTKKITVSFPANVASVKFYLKNWYYNNAILLDNFEFNVSDFGNISTLGENIFLKEEWGESFPLTASFEKPVFYNKLIPVTDFQEFEFSALMKKTGYDEFPHLISAEFYDANNNIITSSIPAPTNLLWSSDYKYWFSNLASLENDQCGEGTNNTWFLNKWKMVYKTFTVPENARWMRLSIETFSSYDIQVLNPILKTSNNFSKETSYVDKNRGSIRSNEQMEKNNILIFPNPTSEIVNIYLKDSNSDKSITLKIYDVYGKLLYSRVLTKNSNQLDVSKYSAGVYLFTFIMDEITYTRKIIIQ